MKTILIATVSAFALAGLSAPVAAQHQQMAMPMPAAKTPAARKAAPNKKKSLVGKPASRHPASTSRRAHAAHRQSSKPVAPMEGMSTPMKHIATAAPTPMPMDHGQPEAVPMPVDHSQHRAMPAQPTPGGEAGMGQSPMDHARMDQMQGMQHGEHAGHEMAMTGALGAYPMERESSGTAWQPDASEHGGVHVMSGDWTLMAHGTLNLVFDHQSGRRGDDKTFASGMLMGTARRPLGAGTLQFKAMVSPDQLMGKSGYPLLLASGETADGVDHLIDRQHPHDFFMELSASVSQTIGAKGAVFLYAGLPGEPAFGPPAFMHREAIMDSPEAPISHHWLDSTHISFGVVTAGLVVDRVKVEVSRFNAREPDQHRWNIETGPLDSTAIRASWNPTRTLSVQGSWGHFEDPEQLEPGTDQKRWSASALYADEIAAGWKLAGTLAWGRKSTHGHDDDAYVAEASLKHARWTLFGRGEITENRELTEIADGPAFRVGKVSLGAVRDVTVARHFSLGLGGLFAVNFVPDALAPSYGGHHPTGAMAFVRLKLD